MAMKFCRDGFECLHLQIEEARQRVKKQLKTSKTDKEINALEKDLAVLKVLILDLESLIVPFLKRGQPLPCQRPNMIVWGRDDYCKALEILNEAKTEKRRREELMKLRGGIEQKEFKKREQEN